MQYKDEERPALLSAFQDGDLGNEICADLELDLEFHPSFDYSWQRPWGLSDEAAGCLHAFAQDGTGGMVCLWQHEEGLSLDAAPVVLCGSEGELEVLALSLADYLVQVVWGFDHFGAGPATLAHDEGARVLGEHGVALVDQAGGLREAAQEAYPGYEAWVMARVQTR